MIRDQTPRDNVCIAPHDIDGDGRVDFALGASWPKAGSVHWLSRGAAPDEPWKVHDLGPLPSTHRMRFADVLGTGTAQLVVSPLSAPEGRPGVALTAYAIPADPARDRWPTTVLDASLNRMHNHAHGDLDGDGRIDTLAASREGVSLLRRGGDGFVRSALSPGIAGATADTSGAGEIRVGRLRGGRLFVVTVEPMHGTAVAVYHPSADGPAAPWRLVLGALDGPPLLLSAFAQELGEPGAASLTLSRLRNAVAAALPERDPIDHQLHAVCLARALAQAGWPALAA